MIICTVAWAINKQISNFIYSVQLRPSERGSDHCRGERDSDGIRVMGAKQTGARALIAKSGDSRAVLGSTIHSTGLCRPRTGTLIRRECTYSSETNLLRASLSMITMIVTLPPFLIPFPLSLLLLHLHLL